MSQYQDISTTQILVAAAAPTLRALFSESSRIQNLNAIKSQIEQDP